MDEQRALLDQLMGVNRNRDREQEEIRDFRDKRVCKFFLCGVCPHGTCVYPFILLMVCTSHLSFAPLILHAILCIFFCLFWSLLLFARRYVCEYKDGRGQLYTSTFGGNEREV